MARTIFAFNGDFESQLALHWLVHERGHTVVALSLDLGQEIYLEPLGELALELGATSSLVLDRRAEFLRSYAFPVLQAGAVYQGGCYLGAALGRYVIANELVRVAREEGCRFVAHGGTTKGNDHIRMEAAISALDPRLEVVAPVQLWPLHTLEDRRNYARRRRLPGEVPETQGMGVDRNLWGVSLFFPELTDPWDLPPASSFVLSQAPENAPAEPALITVGFEVGVPVLLDGKPLDGITLVRELNRLGGLHGIGRTDVIEDRLFGVKSREIYENPAPTILFMAHRALESLVQSRELIQFKQDLSRRYAELVYAGMWFHDLREALGSFFLQSQRFVTGEVQLQLYKGSCRVLRRKSPYSLYDGRLADKSAQDLLGDLGKGLSALWTLPARQAARRRLPESGGGWVAP